MPPEEYLDSTRPYLSNVMNDHKIQSEWKIQSPRQINFICSKNSKEVIISSETNDVTEELHESFLQNYQKGSEESMRGSEFVRDSINLLYYHLQKICYKKVNHIQILPNG